MDHYELDSGDGSWYFCKNEAEMNNQDLLFGVKVFNLMGQQYIEANPNGMEYI